MTDTDRTDRAPLVPTFQSSDTLEAQQAELTDLDAWQMNSIYG